MDLSYDRFKKVAIFVPELQDFAVCEDGFSTFLATYQIQPFGSLFVGDIPLMFRFSSVAQKYLTYNAFTRLCSLIQSRLQKQQCWVFDEGEREIVGGVESINENSCLKSNMPVLLRETLLPPTCPYPTLKPIIPAVYATIERGEYKQAFDSLSQLQSDWEGQEQDSLTRKGIDVASGAVILPLESYSWILAMKISILITQQKYQEANNYLKQLQKLLSCSRQHPFYKKVVILSGMLKMKLEEIGEAMAAFEQAEKLLQENLECQFDVDDQIDLGVVQNNLAICELCLGCIGKSVAKFKQSLQLMQLAEGDIQGPKYNVIKRNLKMATRVGIGGSFSPISSNTNNDNVKTLKQFLIAKTQHYKRDLQRNYSICLSFQSSSQPPKKKSEKNKKKKGKKTKKKSVAKKTSDGKFLPKYSQNYNYPPKYGVVNAGSEEKGKKKKKQ